MIWVEGEAANGRVCFSGFHLNSSVEISTVEDQCPWWAKLAGLVEFLVEFSFLFFRAFRLWRVCVDNVRRDGSSQGDSHESTIDRRDFLYTFCHGFSCDDADSVVF